VSVDKIRVVEGQITVVDEEIELDIATRVRQILDLERSRNVQ